MTASTNVSGVNVVCMFKNTAIITALFILIVLKHEGYYSFSVVLAYSVNAVRKTMELQCFYAIYFIVTCKHMNNELSHILSVIVHT